MGVDSGQVCLYKPPSIGLFWMGRTMTNKRLSPVSTRIRILPEHLTNKIAAGEVVERPASVVKELLENALDAGCTEVVVEIESGGKRLIRVSDNGSGMSKEDALLALERHATSKILEESDLEGISTLGFRGEALPSIASVSRFILASRERGAIEGTEIYAEGGRIREVKACGMADGTAISVRNLFFNTPARLKFLKSPETEAGHVGDLVTKLAISRPDVRFTYINEGKQIFKALDGEIGDRIASLLGRSISAGLYPVSFDDGYITVNGLISSPECSRSAQTHIYTFINGRFVRDKVVQHAILASYRSLLERGRYPVAVLFIGILAGEVDVNVHPTKHEVRFRRQGQAHDAIHAALESVLRGTPWLKVSSTAAPFSVPAPPARPSSTSEQRISGVREALARYTPSPLPLPPPSFARGAQEPPLAAPAAAPAPATGYFSSLVVIGQYNALYILCQDGPDLVIVDQHAAHERVAFERLKGEFAAGRVESQGLLFPETVELSHGEAAFLKSNMGDISRLGYELEEFGGSTWILNAAPRLLAGGDYLRVLRDMLEDMLALGRSRAFADILEEMLSRIACHSVVRGSHPLSNREIMALFSDMDATDFAGNCPHGRPVLQKLTLGEIERMFKRV